MSLRKLFPVLVLGGGVVTGTTGCPTRSDAPSNVDAGTSATQPTGAFAPNTGASSAASDAGTAGRGGAPSGW